VKALSTLAAAAAAASRVVREREGFSRGMDLGSCYLGGNADAVEFCPHRPFRHVLAAATYTLQEQGGERQDRAGSVSLFAVDAGEEDAPRRLRLLHTVETAGVFDMKWSPVAPLLAQADAHGRLALWRLEQEDGSDKGAVCSCICITIESNKLSAVSKLDHYPLTKLP
jgi:diphthamide biosynthesis protein 7